MPSSNALDPQSPPARAIYELAIHSKIIFALIFVIVTGAIFTRFFVFGRAQTSQTQGKPEIGRKFLKCPPPDP